jgi:hypothetical protein
MQPREDDYAASKSSPRHLKELSRLPNPEDYAA